jgi:hypothetical protein
MAVPLKCPTCRSAITTGFDTAVGFVSCPKCGRDVAAPPASARAARSKRSTEDEEDEAPVPARRERSAGGSFLWLWVLLGSSVLGTVAGAGGYLLIVRPGKSKPEPVEIAATPPAPVSEPSPEQKDPAPVPSAPGNSPSGKTPPADPAPSNPPKKAPARPPVKDPAPAGGIPAASTFKGLRFYLPCDRVDNEAVFEAVSGKFVGTGRQVELIDGRRGKAIRVLAGGPPGQPREGLDLSAHVEALAIGEGKPFTIALWVRTEDWGTIGTEYLDAKFFNNDKFIHFWFYQSLTGVGFYLSEGVPGKPVNVRAPKTAEMRPLQPTKDWIHLALMRNEKGVVRFSLNGDIKEIAPAVFPGEFRFNEFSLGWRQGKSFVVDFDEFALFDRVLTDDEIKKLAGVE